MEGAAVLSLLLAVVMAVAPASSGWRSGYFTWYSPGESHMSSHTACGQKFDKYLIGVAAPLGQGWKCGMRVTIKVGSRVRDTKVVDFCGGCASRGIAFDMTARLAIKETGHPPHSAHGYWHTGW